MNQLGGASKPAMVNICSFPIVTWSCVEQDDDEHACAKNLNLPGAGEVRFARQRWFPRETPVKARIRLIACDMGYQALTPTAQPVQPLDLYAGAVCAKPLPSKARR